MEHNLPVGQTGIKVFEVGPWEISEDKWQFSYIAVPTDQCDFCKDRIAKGKIPTCVKHCQAKCLSFGTIEELSKELSKKAKQTLFVVE
jgi:anaerobic dimethyl sulfoxide reductase subunit B (iron-sulfur subunit)